ncbi:MAG: DUF1697 domain-containing protein [bacterium]
MTAARRVRYVAFLRAINVGGHTVKMDRLRTLFEELGLAEVETFIASGNVLFDAVTTSPAALEARIERHLGSALGYEVPTYLRPHASLADVARQHPFEHFERDGHALSIGFLKAPGDEALRTRLAALETDYDAFHVHDRHAYWLCRGRMTSASKVWGAPLDRALGTPATFRNVTTVRKLAARVQHAGDPACRGPDAR